VGSPEPVARLFNLDLPLQFLPVPDDSEQFGQLAVCVRADVLVWTARRPRFRGRDLARWGICTLGWGRGWEPTRCAWGEAAPGRHVQLRQMDVLRKRREAAPARFAPGSKPTPALTPTGPAA